MSSISTIGMPLRLTRHFVLSFPVTAVVMQPCLLRGYPSPFFHVGELGGEEIQTAFLPRCLRAHTSGAPLPGRSSAKRAGFGGRQEPEPAAEWHRAAGTASSPPAPWGQ
jgi:hypothetical protein